MSFSRTRPLPSQESYCNNDVNSSFSRNKNYNNYYSCNYNTLNSDECHSVITSFTRNSHSNNDNNSSFSSNKILRKSRDHHCRGEVDNGPSFKRRKFSNSSWEDTGRHYSSQQLSMNRSGPTLMSNISYPNLTISGMNKSEEAKSEGDVVFMSKDELERCSPSRKDGIDLLSETHLRYSYCAFLQNLGIRLELPQTTIGTAMILCHRFFVRRSHASHDRFVIATAALFLAAKAEETPCPLNNVLKLSYEISHKQDLAFFPYLLAVDWFEQYREQVLEAEHMLLKTLDFELNVQHPYTPLTSVLQKLGLSRSVLVNLAWSLVNEGLRSSLWLQFKPHHIAAGAVFLASKFVNIDLSSNFSMWQEFRTTPAILQDVVQQLMELLEDTS